MKTIITQNNRPVDVKKVILNDSIVKLIKSSIKTNNN